MSASSGSSIRPQPFHFHLESGSQCARTREEVAGGLTLSWGVTPFVVPFDLINPENTIEAALKILVEQGRLHKSQTVVIIGSILVGDQIVDAVQMRVV